MTDTSRFPDYQDQPLGTIPVYLAQGGSVGAVETGSNAPGGATSFAGGNGGAGVIIVWEYA